MPLISNQASMTQGQPGRVSSHRPQERVRLSPARHPQDGAMSGETARVLNVRQPDHHGAQRPRKLKLVLQEIQDLDDPQSI